LSEGGSPGLLVLENLYPEIGIYSGIGGTEKYLNYLAKYLHKNPCTEVVIRLTLRYVQLFLLTPEYHF